MTLRLNGSTSGYVEIDAPATAGSNTLTLPSGNGTAHQVLKNSATAGTLEYGLALPTGNGTSGQYLQTDGAGGSSWAGAGKILQVVKNQKLDVTSETTTSAWTSFTGCTVTITPTSASNKIIGIFSFSHGASRYDFIRNFRAVRGSTVVSDVASGSAVQSTISRVRDLVDDNGANYSSFVFEDDLTGYTSGSITYELQYYATQAGTYYINRSANDSAEWGRGASTFIAVEVAA